MRDTLATEESYTVDAHGKLLLFGEYLALFDFGACGIPLPMYMRAHFIRSHSDTALEIVSHTAAIPAAFYTHLAHVCREYHLPSLSGNITIESEIPFSAGFGSSAAFCVCISKIIVREYSHLLYSATHSEETQLQMIWSIAHSLECFFHYTASGIDTALALYTTPLVFMTDSTKKCTTPSHLQILFYKELCSVIPLENFIVAYTPRLSSTTMPGETIKRISTKIQSYLNAQDMRVVPWTTYHNEVMEILIDSALGRRAMSSDQLIRIVGKYAWRIHRELSALHIASSVTDGILTCLHDQGMCGGKMSGAGVGGAFYVLTTDQRQKNSLFIHLEKYIRTENIDCFIVS